MISTQYAFSVLNGFSDLNNLQDLPFHLQVLVKEICRIQDHLPKSYDKIAQIIATARPLVDYVLNNCGYVELPRPVGKRGREAISMSVFMLMQILAEIGSIASYRQVEREINSHPTWLKALQIKKSPHHSTLGKFRNKMGEEFFHLFFIELTKTIKRLGYINQGDNTGAIIDSAPRDAYMNFARANSDVKLDESQITDFFQRIDVTPFVNSIKTPKKGKNGKKRTYTHPMLVRFLLFEQLGGFLSRSKALRHISKHTHLAKIIGFPLNKIPTNATVSNFEKICGGKKAVIKGLEDQITDYFKLHPLSDDGKVVPFFLDLLH